MMTVKVGNYLEGINNPKIGQFKLYFQAKNTLLYSYNPVPVSTCKR